MEVEEQEVGTKLDLQALRQSEIDANQTCAVILKVNYKNFGIQKKTYDLKILGKTMTDYVANAVFDANIKFAECEFGDDFLPLAKATTDPQSKYTIVLFSDTPLFQHKTFLQIMEYFDVKKLLALKLTRGYVFQTSYLLSLDSLPQMQTQYFEEEDFVTCSSLKQFAIVTEMQKNRILDYFMKNGVVIVDPASTFVDAQVDIAPNVVIEPFNTICGDTIIEGGVHLKSGNKIFDGIVCQNSCLQDTVIKDSFVGKNCNIRECKIFGKSKIGDDVTTPEYCSFDGVCVSKENKLESFVAYKAKEE